MNRFPILAVLWAAVLVAGFAVVFTLGAPVASTVDELQAALNPAPPVSQEAAEDSANTIVRLQHPAFRGVTPAVSRATDFGIDHWLVEYTETSGDVPRGLRISVVLDTGHVEVTTFP